MEANIRTHIVTKGEWNNFYVKISYRANNVGLKICEVLSALRAFTRWNYMQLKKMKIA